MKGRRDAAFLHRHDIGATRLPLAVHLALETLAKLEVGSLLIRFPDGTRRKLGPGRQPAAAITMHDWGTFARVIASGDIGFGEAYIEGLWDSPDLAALLTLIGLNREPLDRAIYGSILGAAAYRIRHWLNANTRRGSRRNIAAHYDLGNDFYALWLDRSMTYSSALFAGDTTQDLELAQRAKYRRILERLRPERGAHILEIGSGWGGFAEMAAREYGCRVTGLTLSREQQAYARERLRNAGVGHRTAVELVDYRDVADKFDHVVSIEMYEAVGERYWPAYFGALHRVLRPGGKAIVQAITIDDRLFDRYRSGTDFIQQHIFPGGMLASPTRFRREAEKAGLDLTDAYAFGRDYAETLKRWRHAFRARVRDVRALGYDERCVRTWEFYLAYCEAGFTTRCTDVYQFELSR